MGPVRQVRNKDFPSRLLPCSLNLSLASLIWAQCLQAASFYCFQMSTYNSSISHRLVSPVWLWAHHCSVAQNAIHSSCSCLSYCLHNLTARTDLSCSPYRQEMVLCQRCGQGLDPPLRLACMGKYSLHLLNVNFSKSLTCLWCLLVFYKMEVFAWCCLLHWDKKKKKKNQFFVNSLVLILIQTKRCGRF